MTFRLGGYGIENLREPTVRSEARRTKVSPYLYPCGLIIKLWVVFNDLLVDFRSIGAAQSLAESILDGNISTFILDVIDHFDGKSQSHTVHPDTLDLRYD